MPSTHHAVSWFCVRTHSKHEHIAAACLRQDLAIEACLPRVSFKRSTPRGPVWFTEALFPNYVFARFNLSSRLLAVQHARGVRGVIHFGNEWPAVPDETIAELRAGLGEGELSVLPDALAPGQRVEISGGSLHGGSAVVLCLLPGAARVAVLLDFLGRQTRVELAANAIVRPGPARAAFWSHRAARGTG